MTKRKSSSRDLFDIYHPELKEILSQDDNSVGRRGKVKPISPSQFKDRRELRNWWHTVLRSHGRYSTFAIFLMLPSDTEAIKYLAFHGNELDLISGENCLVMALSESGFSKNGSFEVEWSKLIEEQASAGYSINIAKLFGIDFTSFPCLLIFEDIRSPEHAMIDLRGIKIEEIKLKMRHVFSIINNAVEKNESPIHSLKNQTNFDITLSTFLVSEQENITNYKKLFKTVMQALIDVMSSQSNNSDAKMQALIDAISSQPNHVVINNELINGDKITTGDIIDSPGAAIGRKASSKVNQESKED